MLVVVINHEHPHEKQSAEDAAKHSAENVEIPKGTRRDEGEQHSRGNHMPPTLGREIPREFLRRKNKLLTLSHLNPGFPQLMRMNR